MKQIFLILFLSGMLFSGVNAQERIGHRKAAIKPVMSHKKRIRYGIASFYAKKFNGRETANGDTFHSAQYTAACNVLPLNTWVKVTNLKNRKSVTVFINDRLHVKSKCLIDLSKNAAYKIGYTQGLAHIKVEEVQGPLSPGG